MEEISTRYCRICGSNILNSEEICPKCGSLQSVERRGPKVGHIIILAAAGIVAIIMLGIISAKAIPHNPSHGDNAYDTSALNSISSAKRSLDGYIKRNGACPDTVEQISFKPDEGVSVKLGKKGDGSCVMVASHVSGETEYAASSRDQKIYRRAKTSPDSGFVAIK